MLADYDYNLPPELVADEPAEPRDSSHLFVYDTARDRVTFDIFANIAKYIPMKSVLVLNDTRVVPSRVALSKATGGLVNILFLFNEWNGGMVIKGLPDKRINKDDVLSLDGLPLVKVLSNNREEFSLWLMVEPAEFKRLVESRGLTPLPPYINSSMDESVLRDKYQSVFATREASVAAPTASLHFTPRVFETLEENLVKRVTVTLHVGRGTFSPVTVDMLAEGSLHPEPVHISAESARNISTAKKEGRTIIAAGTTSLRAIETAADNIMRGESFTGDTKLFVRPPYDFKIADGIITNFHLPGTSLLTLLDAFLISKSAKRSWRDLYTLAISERFRFYSFGDAMLII